MKTEKQDAKESSKYGESPFKPGECLCGLPNCAGHPEEEDGLVHIRNHALGHVVMDFRNWPPKEATSQQ